MLCLSEGLPQEPQGMQTLHLTSAQAEQNVCPADGVLSISRACNATDVEATHASLAATGPSQDPIIKQRAHAEAGRKKP